MKITKEILSGWGNLPQTENDVAYPREENDVAGALNNGQVIPRGMGRSYADQSTNTEHLVLNLTNQKYFLEFDEKSGVLTCEAGLTLDEIIKVLGPRGWFPIVTPGTKYVTIGGAIANDVHGKSHHTDGTFANCVDSFDIMLASGEVLTADRQQNSDLFWANFGGLGLLGIILRATIRLRKIETTYFKQKAIVGKNLDEMLEAIKNSKKEYSSSVAWIDSMAKGKNLGRGVLTVGNHASVKDLPNKMQKNPLKIGKPPKINVPIFLPNFTLNKLTVSILNKVLFFLQKNGKAIAHYDKFFYPLDGINNWNRGYGKKGFIQYQFVLPKENEDQNIRILLEEIVKSGCVPFLNVLKKFGKAGEGHLSFPMEGYTFAIDFPVTNKLKPFTKKLDKMVLEMGGRIYLGKDAYLDEPTFKAMYPQHKEWLKIKQKYDPDNKFSSDLSRRIGLC